MISVSLFLFFSVIRAFCPIECHGDELCVLRGRVDLVNDSFVNCTFPGGNMEWIGVSIEADGIFVDLQPGGSLQISNASHIQAASIDISVYVFHIDTSSVLNASFRGNSQDVLGFGREGGGAGHAGKGASACFKGIYWSVGNAFGGFTKPSAHGGDSVCGDIVLRGGGSIRIDVSEGFIEGIISANGNGSLGSIQCGGAAGGSVWITAETLLSQNLPMISVFGGSGSGGGGGGSGGRIAVHANDPIPLFLYLAAGGASSLVSPSFCYESAGAAGTVYTSTPDPNQSKKLRLPGGSGLVPAQTLLNFSEVDNWLTSLYISSANTSLCGDISLTSDLHATSSSISSLMGSIRIEALETTLISTSVSATKVFLSSTFFSGDLNSAFENFDTLTIPGGNLLMDLSIQGNTGSSVVVNCGNLTMSSTSSVDASSIFLKSVYSSIDAKITSHTLSSDNCTKPVVPPSDCDILAYKLMDSYDVQIISTQTLEFLDDADVSGSKVLLCSPDMTLAAKVYISTESRGCTEEQGIGAGGVTKRGAGGGAGHARKGGRGFFEQPSGNGGLPYDNDPSKFPIMAGSGGGSSNAASASGGTGGGVVIIVAHRTLSVSGTISAKGSDGNIDDSGGAGGGAGGSIGISTSAFIGIDGVFDVRGGRGAAIGGGGGSGGRIFVNWTSTPNPLTDTFKGTLRTHGGTGDGYGENGGYGILSSSYNCGPGTFGLFCAPCLPGSFSNVSDRLVDSCCACPSGSFSSKNGSHTCTICPGGTYSPTIGQSSCTLCLAGSFSSYNSSYCSSCAIGSVSTDNATSCTPCPANTHSSNSSTFCIPCSVGRYSSEGSGSCTACTNAPSSSHYISSSKKCAYKCDPSLVYPLCITVWKNLIREMDGPWVFSVALILSILAIVLPFFICWFKSKRMRHERYLHDCQVARKSSRLMEDARAPLNEDWGHEKEDHMQFHFYRMYLTGNNASTGFGLLSHVDDPMVSLVYPDLFALESSEISSRGRWSRMDKYILKLLTMIYFPLSIFYLDYARQKYIKKIQKSIDSYDYECLRDQVSRNACDSWGFGYSPCMSLSWIDVYRMHNEDTGPFHVGKPCLPMVLLCAGDGSAFSPFYFDPSDPLLKRVSMYFGPKWFIFIANLNMHTRAISPYGFKTSKSIGSAIDYTEMIQCVGIGIGKHMPIGGIDVRLGYAAARCPEDTERLALIIVSASKHPSLESIHGSRVMEEDFVDALSLHTITECVDGYPFIYRAADLLKDDASVFKSSRTFLTQLIYYLFLQRKLIKASESLYHWWLMPLLLIDLILNFVLLTFFAQLQGIAFWIFVACPPFANIIAPLLGFATIALSSAEMSRVLMATNAISVINALACLAVGCYFVLEMQFSFVLGIALPLCLIAVKLVSAQAILYYVAFLEKEKDFILSRVDIFKGEERDLIDYPSLIIEDL